MRTRISPIARRHLVVALCAGAALLAATGAHASECPKDKILTEHADIGWKEDVGVRRKTLTIIDIKDWRQVPDLRFRTRRLTIPPGGVIPTHEHNDRPSIVYFIKGELVEHNSKCAVPITHRAGDIDTEWGDFRHWWENKTNEEVVLLSTDIVPPDFLDDPKLDEPQ